MVSAFELKDIFNDDFCELISKKYNFKENDNEEMRRDLEGCLLYTSPSPRDGLLSRMPSSA